MREEGAETARRGCWGVCTVRGLSDDWEVDRSLRILDSSKSSFALSWTEGISEGSSLHRMAVSYATESADS